MLITAFGPFVGHGAIPRVDENPTREIARSLEASAPPGVTVLARELPVTFRGARRAIDEFFERELETPDLLLGLGVQSRGGAFRLERRARRGLAGDRPDNEGVTASELELDEGPALSTDLDLDRLLRAVHRAGATDARISDDAGQFVCEHAYRALLEWGQRLRRPALFVHVPTVDELATSRQIEIVRALVIELASACAERSR
jgi:pyroglutamyl-peptidase